MIFCSLVLPLVLALWVDAFLIETPASPKRISKAGITIFSSKSTVDRLDLTSYFLPEFQQDATKLSSSSIVEMIPSASSSYAGTSTSNAQPLRQQLFTSPLISVLYERILPPLWEAGLRIGGPDAEYRAAADFLLPTGTDSPSSALLDLSCGTGFVGQRFALAQQYDHVFSLDYSPQMLTELIHSLQRQSLPPQKLSILRGDAGQLPFQDNALDAIHWGAAMHCVPNAEQAWKEVYRVLKPGGKLYATTFLRPFPDVVFRFFTVEELEQMARDVGFGSGGTSSKLRVEGRGVYGIIKAVK
jgi:SAM-dependent methyltransferase